MRKKVTVIVICLVTITLANNIFNSQNLSHVLNEEFKLKVIGYWGTGEYVTSVFTC